MKLPFFLSLLLTTALAVAQQPELKVTAYPSIQKAIDANPGRMIHVPAGDYEITEKLRLRTDNSGLHGPGRIIQTNPNVPIIEIEQATGVRVRDLILTRPEGRMETNTDGILAIRCQRLRIDDVQVLDNRTASAAIALRECRDSAVRGCIIENYSRITVDDRTASAHYGYAFDCISGTGIFVSHSSGTLIQGCRVVERHLLTTPEVREKFGLGKFVKKNSVKGSLISQTTWNEGRVDNWHQGSAIVVTSPEASDHTQLLGNYIENAGQGIDIHADHVTIAQNIVNNAFIGMKAMHGSRNVLIVGNQFTRNDLWAIGLMPGAASHPAVEGKSANADGGSIVANNIISDFGHGHSHWIWGSERSPFKFDSGQEPDDPPLTDVIIQGNVLHSIDTPRYKFAVIIDDGANTPKGLHFSNNILTPGTAGIANRDLPP
ncbi:MAG: right-handed parallel beta-helix repeat-containing protein [Verrucomicrobiota bacterium]